MSSESRSSIEELDEFVLAVEGRDDTIYMGIDPGFTGAIGLLCGRRQFVLDIPTIASKVRRRRPIGPRKRVAGGPKSRVVLCTVTSYDYAGIVEVFRGLRPIKRRVAGCLEIPHAGAGIKGVMAIQAQGAGYGMWPLFLFSRGYSLLEVDPSVWKRAMGLSGKDKNVSRSKAVQLFPRAGPRLSRVKDHNRAEALLLAEYLRRVHRGKSPR